MASIIFNDVFLEYPILNVKDTSFKQTVLKRAVGGKLGSASGFKIIKALNGMSFSINDGDRVGIIGRNGAGKSTLLRVMSGIYEPTKGSVEVSGSVMPIIDKNIGVDHEITGYEYIILRGLFLNLKKEVILQKMDDIIEFTDLRDFIYLPIYSYSDGMMMRLSFAITTALRSDILVMDEWISAGDSEFKQKAGQRLNSMIDESNIVVIASHSENLIKKWCNKALWLDQGTVKMFAGVDEVIDRYKAQVKCK